MRPRWAATVVCCATGGRRWLSSRRILGTDPPVIVQMKALLEGTSGVLSLAQGIVFWEPPAASIAAGVSEARQSHQYAPAEGIPELREALGRKIEAENGLTRSELMVTAGANQAYANLVLTLLDEGDRAVLFRPYYFNHLMALQMTGVEPVLAPTTRDLLPDVEALEEALGNPRDGKPAKLVTLVNPGNPTGTMIPQEMLEEVGRICERHGAWLVADNTYENFAWEHQHACLEGDHVVNIFSFSKAYGMAGWRLGYLAYPPSLAAQLAKVQDTVVIAPTSISQRVALAALERAGSPWVRDRIADLAEPKRLVHDALADALGPDAVRGGTGAIYLLATLPEAAADDVRVAETLITEYGVATIPGSACGAPGTIRVCYANLPVAEIREASRRLSVGLKAIVSEADLRARARPQ